MSAVVREFRCCVEKATHCPVVRALADGKIEVVDDYGGRIVLDSGASAESVASSLVAAADALDDLGT